MTQLDLFDRRNDDNVLNDSQNDSVRINGLRYIRDFITNNDHARLLNAIDSETWLDDLKRRVQHYGYKYDYKKRRIDDTMFLGSLPMWAAVVAEKVMKMGLMAAFPDQVIVNEYLPGQGIAEHIDCEPCFGDEIVSLSLGSPCVMELKTKQDRSTVERLLLNPRSLLVLSGDARYRWTHGIPARTTDVFDEITFQRSRRVSLTFRKVISMS